MGKIAIDPSVPTPLYFQLQQQIIALIEDGTFPVGTPLPSELQLIEETGLSRTTVRQAIQNLVDQGRLVKRRGVGTFVCATMQHEWDLSGIRSLREAARLEGKTCTTRQLAIEITDNDQRALAVFGPDAGPLFRLERLRLIDEMPAIVVTTFVPASCAPNLDSYDFSKSSLFDVMEHQYNIELDHAVKVLSARAADSSDANLLELKPGAPIQFVESITYTSLNIPVEYSLSRDRSDISTYRVYIDRRGR